jgi:hypothetical protein
VVLASTSWASIASINVNYIDGGFTASGGDYAKGVFSLADAVDVVVEDTGGVQTTYDNGFLSLSTSLFDDVSVFPIASGEFLGGSFSILDNSSAALLMGDIIFLNMAELYDNIGILAGVGQFEVTGGSLSGDFIPNIGDIVQITFQIVPAAIDDFSQNFSGVSNLTLIPIPEPLTLGLLAVGAGLLRRRR